MKYNFRTVKLTRYISRNVMCTLTSQNIKNISRYEFPVEIHKNNTRIHTEITRVTDYYFIFGIRLFIICGSSINMIRLVSEEDLIQSKNAYYIFQNERRSDDWMTKEEEINYIHFFYLFIFYFDSYLLIFTIIELNAL